MIPSILYVSKQKNWKEMGKRNEKENCSVCIDYIVSDDWYSGFVLRRAEYGRCCEGDGNAGTAGYFREI